ncbi:MAG TPA: hypothetical protein PKE45_04570, partial [Caldilineaceae bacterium]|nr:hypothetical protein [Caldilineaceae bacterium]
SNRRSHSSAFQSVELPGNAVTVTLRYWQQPGGSSDGVDYQEALLLRADYSLLTTVARDYALTGAGQWSERSFDLSRFAGQTVVVYFNVYNNGGGGQQWSYLDEAALIVCTPLPATATPEETPTMTVTATPTPLSTPPANL